MSEFTEKATPLLVSPGTRNDNRIDYRLSLGGRSYPVYFSCERIPLSCTTEATVSMIALGAMFSGQHLQIAGAVSPEFLANQQRLMAIFTGWFPEYNPIKFEAAEQIKAKKTTTGRVGCFFTGGVDSFYTFLKHRNEITDLIFVHGYDVRLDDHTRREAVSTMGETIEKATGVRFIELETNCIRLFKDFGRWGLNGHGYGLGSAARHLTDYLDRLYVPSSFSDSELMPWASHPATDPLFSDESLEVIHDGCEASRVEKLMALGSEPLVLDHLRVCYEHIEGPYNCGRCEKCLRTITTLYALGTRQCRAFPQPLEAKHIRQLVIYSHSMDIFARQNIDLLEHHGYENSDIAIAWRQIVARSPLHNKLIMKRRRLFKKFQRIGRKIISR